MGGALGGARDMSRKPKRTHRVTYGQGSFQWVESKKTWRGRIDAGFTPDGKRRRVEVTNKDEDKAWAKFLAKKAEIEAGTLTSSEVERMTVKAWAEAWLNERQTHVRPKTFATDASIVNKWITPVLGRKQLRDLGPSDVRLLATRMREAGRSTTTIRYAQRIFQQLCTAAKAEGYKVSDTVLLAKKANVAVSDRDAIPLDQALALLETSSQRRDGSRWVAALLQGMRQAECLGLTWEHVDLDAGTIDVSWQLQALPYADREREIFRVPDGYETRHLWKAFHLVRPKTARGHRVIPLVPWMTAALTTWKQVAPDSPYGLVWPREDGRPQSTQMDGAAWKALQDTAKVSKNGGHYVLHEARHTTATLLLEAGVDPEVIKTILGHSSIVTSRGYQHVSQELTRRALEQVAATLQLET